MKTHRLARVSEVIRETAAETILFQLRDPRIKGVTVTRAEVSADLQHAKIYVSVMGSEKEQKLAMHGLRAASGFVQTKIAKQLTTRFVPAVIFVLDDGVKKSIEIAKLIEDEKAKMKPVDETAEDHIDEEEEFDEEEESSIDESPSEAKNSSTPGPADGMAS
jgi:ribosome-binding factor A